MNQILPMVPVGSGCRANPAFDAFVLARLAASIAFVRWLETATAEEIALETDGTVSLFRQLADIEMQLRETRT